MPGRPAWPRPVRGAAAARRLRAGPAAARFRPVPAEVPEEQVTGTCTSSGSMPADRRARRPLGRATAGSWTDRCRRGTDRTGRLRAAGLRRRALPRRLLDRPAPVDLDEAEQQARTNLRGRRAGAARLRFAGGHPAAGRPGRPAGADPGRPAHRAARRYIRELGVDLEDPADLPAEVARQARPTATAGSRSSATGSTAVVGDLAPCGRTNADRGRRASRTPAGARVTTHVFGEDALPGLLAAGRRLHRARHRADRRDHRGTAAARNVHLVPTVINIANFPSFADAAGRFPTYAKHMRELHARNGDMVRTAVRGRDPGARRHRRRRVRRARPGRRRGDRAGRAARRAAGAVRRVAQRPGVAGPAEQRRSVRRPTCRLRPSDPAPPTSACCTIRPPVVRARPADV